MAEDPSTSALTEPKLPGRTLWPRRIGRRLALGFGALVLLMLLVLSQVGWQLKMVSDVTQRFATGDMQRLLRVQALSILTEGVGSAMIRLMNAPRESRVMEYAEVDERNRRIDGIVESLINDLKDSGQEDTLQRLKASRTLYAQAFIATVDEVEADDLQAASRALNEQINPALKAMLTESNMLLSRERERIEGELEAVQSKFRKVTMWVGLISLLVVVLAAWLAWRTTRSVVGPLAQLELAARHIADGDYAVRVPSSSAQEVDRVGLALNTMAEAVAHRENQIVRLAYSDPLTGLPNRTALLTPAQEREDACNALVLMDLARLKVINETLGYATGDTLIKEIAVRASAVFQAATDSGLIGSHPVVARLSGGTFAAFFKAADRETVEILRERMELALTAPAVCGEHSVDLNLTYGFAQSTTHQPVNTLMRNAEVALHAAKRAASGFAWYSEAQEAARLGHLSLVSDLRLAVANSQLQMWLQPKYSLATGKAVGAEALVRWQHPTRGFVSPAEFVPFAEQTGYISMVTHWMLTQAVDTLARWAPVHPELSIAVNLSTRDLLDAGLAARIQGLLLAQDVNPKSLRLEITESGLMEDPARSVELLHSLRETGMPLSIDDFGTGYSSLAYLHKLPVNELKIDRSFVDGIDKSPASQRLMKTMIEMGHGLDMMVTAEGIETEAERSTIAALGCDVMQGYLASKPLFGAALQTWYEAL
jgi:diguanylate cyclase (GGDEF)-like protein